MKKQRTGIKGKGWGHRDRATTAGYYKELMRIKRRRGALTPEAIVTEAAAVRSPLHSFFEWDDTTAAQKFRLNQAVQLVRTVCVQVVRSGSSEPVSVHVFHNVESETASGEKMTHYVTVKELDREPRMKSYVMEQALARLRSWTAEYESLKGLRHLVKLINGELDRIERAKRAA